jgi:hypothetical protein
MSTLATLPRGDQKSYAITCSESLDTATSVIFTAKKSKGLPDSKATFQHSLGAGITVSGATATVAIVHNDTASLTCATTLFCDIQASFSGRSHVTVWEGTLPVALDVTQESDTSVDIHTTSPSATTSAIAAAAAAAQSASDAADDAEQTALDRIATGEDRTQTGLDRVATGEDRTATGEDRTQTGLDRVATGEDVEATGLDRVATGEDRTQTGLDRIQTGLDRVATGEDRTATAADRVQTGLDRSASSASAAAALVSQNAAALSAVQAAQAVAQQYKGGLAGASVPATSTAAGDTYRITSAGTSQSITWTTGDLAIYNGTSGSWTRVPAGVVDEPRAVLGDASRAVTPVLYSDGATANRRIEWTPGSTLAGGLPVTVNVWDLDVPTSNPSPSAAVIVNISGSSTPTSPVANSLRIAITGTGGLAIGCYGATDTDFRLLTHATFRAAYSGRKGCKLTVTWASGDTTTNPTILLDGVDITANFTLTTGGTAPNWLPPTLDTTKFLAAYNWPAGRAPMAEIGLGVWTLAEHQEWVQTGRKPTWWEGFTGNASGCFSPDFATSNGFTTTARASLANNQDNITDGTTSLDNCLKLYADGTPAASHYAYGGLGIPAIGCRVLVTGRYFIPAAQTHVNGWGIYNSTLSAQIVGLSVVGVWTTINEVIEITSTTDLRFVLKAGATTSFDGANSETDDFMYFSALKLRVLGPVIKPVIQPIPYVADWSANAKTGTIASGITPLMPSKIGDRAPVSATFLHSAISAANGTTTFFSLPANWAIVDFQCNADVAFDAGSTISVGTSASPTRWVNALLVDTTGPKQATSLQLYPQSLTAATTVYIKKSGTTTVGNLLVCTAILERKY